MKTSRGEDISVYQAAKRLYVMYGEQYRSYSTAADIIKSIDIHKITVKQQEQLFKYLDDISKRVRKYLKIGN